MTNAVMPQLKIGDTITIDVLDRRLWPRFIAWLRGRPAPKIRQRLVVTIMCANSDTSRHL